MSDEQRTAIRCRGLVKRFPDVTAVAGVDLDVSYGECFALLGPNGAGKTTTVKMLEGLLAPDAGEIEILGVDGGSRSRELRQRLGIQLQQTQLVDKLTVRETLALFRSFYDRGADPEHVLSLVQLEEKARARVGKLSGGQRQRLSLACALVGEPELLFLDEPTTGLDPQSRLQVWDIVGEFRRRGGTVLMTTHYMEEASRLCDRVAILDHGQVIAQGSPAELIASLGAEHVIELEASELADDTAFGGIEGVCAVGRENRVIRLTVRELHRALPAVLDELRRQGGTLNRLLTHHATLEDVFVTLTGRHLREE